MPRAKFFVFEALPCASNLTGAHRRIGKFKVARMYALMDRAGLEVQLHLLFNLDIRWA
jgi:hypothetical protein